MDSFVVAGNEFVVSYKYDRPDLYGDWDELARPEKVRRAGKKVRSTCTIRNAYSMETEAEVMYVGRAFLNPEDKFNRSVGRAIAFERALAGVDVSDDQGNLRVLTDDERQFVLGEFAIAHPIKGTTPEQQDEIKKQKALRKAEWDERSIAEKRRLGAVKKVKKKKVNKNSTEEKLK